MKHSELNEAEVAQYWNGNADLWAEQVRQGWDACREYINNPAFFRLIGNVSGRKVLDAGCGEGYNTRILAKKGAQVVGIDISSRMVELARQAEQEAPLGIRYEVASFSKLSLFDDASFDAVVASMALMDCPDYEAALKEFHRVLRKKGKLFFNVTHPCFMTRGFDWVMDEQQNPVKITASDYFDRQPWVEYWKFSMLPNPDEVEPFAVPSFSRTLSDYINGLFQAGFILKKIQEPRPSREACRKHPWLRRWRDIAALFLQVSAVKP